MEQPSVFISYAREDGDFALRLATDLRQAGVNLWMDRLDIQTGERWDRAIERALETLPALLLILSPASVASENVMDEVSFALEEGKRVLPVLHRSCKTPFRLRRVQRVDLSADYRRGLSELTEDLGRGDAAVPVAPAGTAASASRKLAIRNCDYYRDVYNDDGSWAVYSPSECGMERFWLGCWVEAEQDCLIGLIQVGGIRCEEFYTGYEDQQWVRELFVRRGGREWIAIPFEVEEWAEVTVYLAESHAVKLLDKTGELVGSASTPELR